MTRKIDASGEDDLYYLAVLPHTHSAKEYRRVVSRDLLFDGVVVEIPADQSGRSEIKGDGRMIGRGNLPVLLLGSRRGSELSLQVVPLQEEGMQNNPRPLRYHFSEFIPGQFHTSDANVRCILVHIPNCNPADFLR